MPVYPGAQRIVANALIKTQIPPVCARVTWQFSPPEHCRRKAVFSIILAQIEVLQLRRCYRHSL